MLVYLPLISILHIALEGVISFLKFLYSARDRSNRPANRRPQTGTYNGNNRPHRRAGYRHRKRRRKHPAAYISKRT